MAPSSSNPFTAEILRELLKAMETSMEKSMEKLERNINEKISNLQADQNKTRDSVAQLTTKVDVSISQQANDAKGLRDAEESTKGVDGRVKALETKSDRQEGAISILRWLTGTLGAATLANLFMSLATKGH